MEYDEQAQAALEEYGELVQRVAEVLPRIIEEAVEFHFRRGEDGTGKHWKDEDPLGRWEEAEALMALMKLHQETSYYWSGPKSGREGPRVTKLAGQHSLAKTGVASYCARIAELGQNLHNTNLSRENIAAIWFSAAVRVGQGETDVALRTIGQDFKTHAQSVIKLALPDSRRTFFTSENDVVRNRKIPGREEITDGKRKLKGYKACDYDPDRGDNALREAMAYAKAGGSI